MTDTQILTLALTLLGIFAASWFNNSRIGDVNNRIGDVNNRIGDMRDVLRAEFKAEISVLRAETTGRFDRLDAKLDAILKICGDLESRIHSLEAK